MKRRIITRGVHRGDGGQGCPAHSNADSAGKVGSGRGRTSADKAGGSTMTGGVLRVFPQRTSYTPVDVEIMATAYFEDAIRESSEIIGDCTPTLQVEPTVQRGHFLVALNALRTSEHLCEKYRRDTARRQG